MAYTLTDERGEHQFESLDEMAQYEAREADKDSGYNIKRSRDGEPLTKEEYEELGRLAEYYEV
jgi:hypothetical protein